MARRIAYFFALVVMTFALASYLVLGGTLDKLQSDKDRQQQRIYSAIQEQLRTSYALLHQVLQFKSSEYKHVHQAAQEWVEKRGHRADLTRLQQQLSERVGFNVDLFIIDRDLVVTNTTFLPDLGLDFNHPAFVDAQNYLRLSRQQARQQEPPQQEPGQQGSSQQGGILVSQPTMELVSRQYKVYSYSALPDGSYLELGFIDPQLKSYFDTFLRQSVAHPDVNVELFLEMWGVLLMRIGDEAPSDPVSKLAAVNQQIDQMALEHIRFKQVFEGGSPQTRSMQGRQDNVVQIYDELMTLEPVPGLTMRLLSKVTFIAPRQTSIEQRFVMLFAALLGVSVLFLCGLMFLVRYRLIEPLQKMVNAMRSNTQIDTDRWSLIPELTFLAANYNQMLAKNRKQVEALESLSISDPLTGLYNRRHLDNVLEHEMARALRNGTVVAYAMVDVDYFKAYNDLYGHQGGDLVLKTLADTMQCHFRRVSDFVFRYGGEEFAVLVTDTVDSRIFERFDALRVLVDEAVIPHHGSAISDNLTISIGVCFTEGCQPFDHDEVVKRADLALYKAKEQGRNRVVMDAILALEELPVEARPELCAQAG